MTQNQERAVDNVIKQRATGNKVNLGNALKDAGYAPSVTKNPKVVTESLGFKEAMAKYGLTEEKWASYLAADLEAKPKERLGELKLAAEVMNLTKQNINLSVQRSDESMSLIEGILDDKSESTD